MIVGNFIGVDVTGTVDLGNASRGVYVFSGAVGNTVGGTTAAHRNIISGNDSHGIEISGTTTGTIIQGNYIGTDVTGLNGIRNEGHGVRLSSNVGTVVGGTVGDSGNVISGNDNSGTTADGIYIFAGSGHTIQGNFIGLAADGSTAPGNYYAGVALSNSGGNLIGGTTVEARNMISANRVGVVIGGPGSIGNNVQGNYIGTDSTGLLDRGNSEDGIVINNGATVNTIGGDTAAHRNIISGNDNDGIWITGSGTSDNTVQGNWIGLDAAEGSLGNSYHGIGVQGGAADNLIGGTDSGEGNSIANNSRDGISTNSSGTGNSFLGNYIYGNGDLGIDIEAGSEDVNGVTANDANDVDSGTNNLQNLSDHHTG